VNAGLVGGGTATNVIPEESYIEGELRGATTELAEYMSQHADRILESAAEMHDCEVAVSTKGEAAERDERRRTRRDRRRGRRRRRRRHRNRRSRRSGRLRGRHLPDAVGPEARGLACYVGVGTDHPGGHHTSTFDVVEGDIAVGIDVLAGARSERSPRRGPEAGRESSQNRTSDSAELPFSSCEADGTADHWRPRIQQTTIVTSVRSVTEEAVIRPTSV